MIAITSTPVRNVNDNASFPSRWFSVHQPMLFNIVRQDHPVSSVQVIGANYRIILPSIPAGLAAGQRVWLKSGANNQLVTVTSITGLQVHITGTNLTAITVGGYINLIDARKNYYIEFKIFGVDANSVYFQVGTHDAKPSPDGSFSFDPHGYLKKLTGMGDRFPYNVLNKKQIDKGSRFNFTYQEFWTGSSTTPSTLATATTYYWVNGMRQLHDRYNFNFGAYVPFITLDTAKFLSVFKAPTYFPGFPFSLSFIWSDKVAGRLLQRVEDYDVNDPGSPLVTTQLDHSQHSAVNMMMLAGGYPSTLKEIDVWLNDAGIVSMDWVGPGWVGAGWVAAVPYDTAVKTK